MFRASTELHVFIVIVCALILQKTDLSREDMTQEGYDWILLLGDGTIAIADLDALELVSSVRDHTGAVHALLWLRRKGWLVSGSADTTIRTWRIRDDSA